MSADREGIPTSAGADSGAGVTALAAAGFGLLGVFGDGGASEVARPGVGAAAGASDGARDDGRVGTGVPSFTGASDSLLGSDMGDCRNEGPTALARSNLLP